MSLNNIQLFPIVLQELYKNVLIDLKIQEVQPPLTPAKGLFTLGNNKQRILVLVAGVETLYLPDEELNFLLGILAACNLTMEDVAILNIKKNKSLTYLTLTEELAPVKLLLFGVTPNELELPIEFPNYQIQHYNNQVYLTAPPLSQFQDNKPEKTRLWNCLKQIFTI